MPQTAQTAICFLVADTRHRIPRRPLHRCIYRHTRQCIRRLVFASERQRGYRCDDYRPGLVAAVASIRKRSRNVPPILLLTPDDVKPPPGIDRVVRIDPRLFESVRGAFYEFGVTVFFKLAVFSLGSFDRLVYLDSDTLAVNDVSALWDLRHFCDRGFYGVRETKELGAGTDAAVGKFNTGVMVINRPMLDGRAYEELMRLARSGATYDGGDQGVINALLSRPGSPYESGELAPYYNVFVNDWNYERGVLDRISPRILHFAGATKPWSALPGWEHRHEATFRRAWRALAASDHPTPLAAGFSVFGAAAHTDTAP